MSWPAIRWGRVAMYVRGINKGVASSYGVFGPIPSGGVGVNLAPTSRTGPK